VNLDSVSAGDAVTRRHVIQAPAQTITRPVPHAIQVTRPSPTLIYKYALFPVHGACADVFHGFRFILRRRSLSCMAAVWAASVLNRAV